MAKRGRGRPDKLSPERTKRICDLLKQGNPRRTAAVVSGIGQSTFALWIADGREARELAEKGEKLDRRQKATLDFLTQVEVAEEFSIGLAVQRVQNAAADPKNWTAAAWFLERKRPDEFGRRLAVKHSGDAEGGPVRVSVEERQRVLGSLASDPAVLAKVAAAIGEADDLDWSGEPGASGDGDDDV